MKLYICSFCGNSLYFENNVCLNCGHTVGFDSISTNFLTLNSSGNGVYSDIKNDQSLYAFCKNAEYGTCNWLVSLSTGDTFCAACQLNGTIPTLSPENMERWKRIEIAKHRLVYSLMRLKLPIQAKKDTSSLPLTFDFLASVTPENQVMTGHVNGVITLNIEEADEAQRVKNKLDLGEKYRTLLGHFRHETGHYYWDLLIKPSPSLVNDFRDLFGNETADYTEALKVYYEKGAPHNWMDNFISPYASSHPWEDWAETWSHYLHMMDTLETAYSFGLEISPRHVSGEQQLDVVINRDPYTIRNFSKVFELWLPLTFAVNSLNRSMGHPDFYPFIISPRVVEKLQFIHGLCKSLTA
jgi:hypothetical protein